MLTSGAFTLKSLVKKPYGIEKHGIVCVQCYTDPPADETGDSVLS